MLIALKLTGFKAPPSGSRGEWAQFLRVLCVPFFSKKVRSVFLRPGWCSPGLQGHLHCGHRSVPVLIPGLEKRRLFGGECHHEGEVTVPTGDSVCIQK